MEPNAPYAFAKKVLQTLNTHNIEIDEPKFSNPGAFYESFTNPNQFLRRVIQALERSGNKAESEAISHVLRLCVMDIELGGMGIAQDASSWDAASAKTLSEVEFLVDAWLSAVSSAKATAANISPPLKHKSPDACQMTLAEKILAHHAFSVPSEHGVRPGDLVRVSVDWIIASEVAWIGMMHSMNKIGMAPRAWRNDRFWLVGDHAVDPRNYKQEKSQMLMKEMEIAKRKLKMTENQGSNYTILHTEFVRERAEPGMLVLGADSHTCSAGAVGSLAIGLGAGDVMIGLATGQTWLKIPESIWVNFTSKPAWYISGKDVILAILRELRRNTYAADRVVEFGGPGAQYLSCDARFAISNMCTELGAITGIFVPDGITQSFVNGRNVKLYRSNSVYFAPDEGAEYAATFNIDLGQVESSIAMYPSPDDVHPVTEKLGMRFDGCFIGACTTTEEDLILAALVLEAGLKRGLPLVEGKRVVVPGSRPILKNLRKLRILDIYERAGFEQPAPGCSLCLGMGADVADEGSNWLSSQNRNFKNRMGKGAVGHICSAATVAASSFSMILVDPTDLLRDVSESKYKQCLESCKSWRKGSNKSTEPELGEVHPVEYVEPNLAHVQAPASGESQTSCCETDREIGTKNIRGKIYRMGDFVDTDAIIPAPFCSSPTNELLGSHCFEYVHPEFREHVRSGFTVVVGGRAFGCGSSREEAARALKGLGVQCVIAKTFSFIFGRNMPTIGLLGFTITEDEFYSLAYMGAEIEVDLQGHCVRIGGQQFPFRLDDMELKLVQNHGLAESFRRFSNDVYELLCSRNGTTVLGPALADISLQRQGTDQGKVLAW